VYAVSNAGEPIAKFEILAYYCREVGAACYTMRYQAARPRRRSTGGAHVN
jgi:hypothetical protein